MKVFEDDCELRWSMEKLELGGQILPLSGKRSGNQCVTANVREGDETSSHGSASRAELTLRINAAPRWSARGAPPLPGERLSLQKRRLGIGELIPSSISHWGV